MPWWHGKCMPGMSNTDSGLLLCARYAFAPNHYHFCGPEKQRDVFEYVNKNVSDRGLADILHRFETLYPYLVLIASQNGMKDPFDRRVVEAYWLGNDLLKTIKAKAFGDHLSDALQLKKKLPARLFSPMINHVVSGVPHHVFHVMNIFPRTGHAMANHTLHTMDECRISWGRVDNTVNAVNRTPVTSDKIIGNQYVIQTRPLEYKHGNLVLGDPIRKVVTSIAVVPKIGDWVSVHWGFICDVLSKQRIRQLERYTRYAIAHANKAMRNERVAP